MVHSVSVIIPTMDRGGLLDRAIKSIVNQSVKAQEILVVDNGKVDASISSELSKEVTIIRTPPCIGPGRSRNIGVENAATEFVAFLDDDDYWESDYLQHSINMLPADVVVGQLKRLGLDGRLTRYKMFPADLRKQRRVYYKNPGFGGQNILIRRQLFISVGGFDENMPASVDRDLAAKVMQKGAKIVVQPLSVAVLCDHHGVRVRQSQVVGNRLFIKKHWRNMSIAELFKALRTYFRRLQSSKRL